MITLKQAAEILDTCVREELRDHAFGDAEVYWLLDGKMIASGYFGNSGQGVSAEDNSWSFKDENANELRRHGRPGKVSRNDSGPNY